MTIHSAKGLEFDLVILPGLGKQPSGDRSQLLYWLEQASEAQEAELLFGPIKAAGQRDDGATAAYIKGLEAKKRELETGRLLYVAATRARKQLHLLGHVALNRQGELTPPPKNSLLYSLWPVVAGEYQHCLDAGQSDAPEQVEHIPGSRYQPRPRLVADWTCPVPVAGRSPVRAVVAQPGPLEFDWVSDMARQVGVVVHRLLEYLAGAGAVDDGLTRVDGFDPTIGRMLAAEGLSGGRLEQARRRVVDALNNTLDDERGRWVLSSRHEEARSELRLTARVAGEIRHLVIDRTFVDQGGVRWVIDYKTSSHTGGNAREFLDREQERYRAQLETYAALFRESEGRPVRMALYFPLLRGWREWADTD
jgi:ATP-dependent exoDNAse (exonuclease V) beta subunit